MRNSTNVTMLRKFLRYNLIKFCIPTVCYVVNIKNISYKMDRNVCDLSKQRTTMIASIALLLPPWNRGVKCMFPMPKCCISLYKVWPQKECYRLFLKDLLIIRQIFWGCIGFYVFLVSLKKFDVNLTAEYFCNKTKSELLQY